jgi:U3 small nucleolar RNA-associated protein 3
MYCLLAAILFNTRDASLTHPAAWQQPPTMLMHLALPADCPCELPATHPPSSSSPRRKDLKNPRKKNRIKFAQASTRRKGQVQGVRPAQGAGYGGEATGIKAKVAKSTRLG